MEMKKLLASLLAGTAALSMAACSGSGDSGSGDSGSGDTGSDEKKTVTMTVSGPSEDQTSSDDPNSGWLQAQCEAFAAEHPDWDITFNYKTIPEGSAGDELAKDPEAGPDVYLFASDQTGRLIEKNAISRFGGTALDTINNENDPSMVSTVTYNDGVYGVPFTSNTWFMFYNKDIFTPEDVTNLDTMLEKGPVSFPLDNFWYSASFFYGAGCTIYGADGNDVSAGVDFDNENGLAALNYLIDLVNNPNFTNDEVGTGVGLSKLRDGSVGNVFSGSWEYENLASDMGDKLGLAGAPAFNLNGTATPLRAYLTSKAVGVNPNSKDLEVANALALYLGGESAQKAHWEQRSVVPCNTKLLEDESIKSSDLVTAQNDTVANAVPQPSVSQMANIFTFGENFGKSIVSGEVNHDNAQEKLTDWVTQMNNITPESE